MTTQIEVTPAWTNYVDLTNDVKPWLQYPSGSSPDDVKLQMVVDMACWWAQDYLGRPIAPTSFFRRFSGYTGLNGAYINLPYYPVLEMVKVTEWWGLSGPHVLVEQTPEAQGGGQMYQMDYLRGTIIRTFAGLIQRPFFPGSRNVEVEWIAGYDPLPPTFKMGTLELIKYWWSNTQQASRGPFVAHSEYGQPEPSNIALWPAVPNRVAEMFSTGVQIGMG